MRRCVRCISRSRDYLINNALQILNAYDQQQPCGWIPTAMLQIFLSALLSQKSREHLTGLRGSGAEMTR